MDDVAIGQDSLGLDSLPDDLLGRCLGLLPRREGFYITLVCKRFCRLFFEQPSLWRSFTAGKSFREGRLPGRHAVLQRVAPHVEEFRWRDEVRDLPGRTLHGELPVAEFLRLLPPSLTALELWPRHGLALRDEEIAQLLQPLTALRSLRTRNTCLTAAAVQRMPHLQHFESSYCEDGLLDALCQLSGLTALRLGIASFPFQPPLQCLTQLSTLRRLSLTDADRYHSMCPPVPAAFPHLEAFQLKAARCHSVQVADESINYCGMAPLELSAEGLIGLRLEDGQLQSLPSLLAAVVPPALTLQALSLSGVRFDATALRGCTQLAAVQWMELQGCDLDAETLETLFGCTPCLATLHARCEDSQHAQAVCQVLPAHVRSLRLGGGPDILPPELLQLTMLEHLDLSQDGEWNRPAPTVTESELEQLCGLPHLHTLVVYSRQMPSVPAHVLAAVEHRHPGVLREDPLRSLFSFDSWMHIPF